MKSPTVILHCDNPDAARDILQQQHPDLSPHLCRNYEELSRLIETTDAEVVYSVRTHGTPTYPGQLIRDSATVKWVSVGGSGTDHLNPWDPGQLTITNAAGVAADMMAQYALGSMLHFSLNFPLFQQAQKRQEWLAGEVEPIDGKTVLIIGMGKTGEAVARRCKAMDMQTLGVRARPAPVPHVDEVHGIETLPELWKRADFIVVCVPLLDSTRNLVDSVAFEAMKDTAVIIDVSRGGVIEENALLKALDTNRIRGAALDVFATEPLPESHRLWRCENVIITPHCSSVYRGWDLKSVAMFSDNLLRYRKGEALSNIVNPSRGY
ncbi:D-2-hydroxyacid dehydrogenase [Kiloniella sp. b19]|uniref:D-2-hydroxyacid dehydrogenase n=1 Tax=Kiloniella sp. GXU_MW_B19 TaxID=3141326 RepID=UPI0031DEC02B